MTSFSLPHRIWRAVADWIRAVLLRITATPYECYWRDRAFAAEKEASYQKMAAEQYRRLLQQWR